MNRVLLLTVLILLTACGQGEADTQTPPAPTISLLISGSGGTTPVLAAIAPEFVASHPNYRINTLQGSSTSGGIDALQEQLLDVAAMGRATTADELAIVSYARIGQASEVPIINPAAGITDITGDELRAIFSGEIDDWSVLGGVDMPIQVFVRSQTSIHTQAMRDVVFENIEFAAGAALVNGMGAMIKSVETTDGAIGYAAYPTVLAMKADVNIVAFDGIDPTAETYPGLLEIGLSYLPDREQDLAPFVAWLQSEDGKATLRELRVVP